MSVSKSACQNVSNTHIQLPCSEAQQRLTTKQRTFGGKNSKTNPKEQDKLKHQ